MFKGKILKNGLILSLFIILVYIYYSVNNISFIEYFELKTYDMRFKLRNAISPPEDNYDVVIVAVDEKSLVALGPWPWNRKLHGQLIKELTTMGALSIGFDLSFSEKSRASSYMDYKNKLKTIIGRAYKEGELELDLAKELAVEVNKLEVDEDLSFANALESTDNAIIGTYNILSRDEVYDKNTLEDKSYYKNRYYQIKGIEGELKELEYTNKRYSKPFEVYKILGPIEPIASSSFGIAPYEVGYPDPDGVLRGIVAVTKEVHSKLYFPPLYLLTYLRAFNIDIKRDVVYNIQDKSIDLYKNEKLHRSIPTNINAYQRLNFYGPSNTFENISYIDILEGEVDRDRVEGKIVLVGYTDTAKGLYDLRATPLDPNTAGVELHATAIQNLIDNKFMLRLDMKWQALILFITLVLITVAIAAKNSTVGHFTTLILILVYISLSYLLFINNYWIDIFYPLLSMSLIYIVLNTEEYFGEEAEKRYIRSVFGAYINPELIKELVEEKHELKLGGEKRRITVFFSDIASFTSISEKLQPEELIEYLNIYLSQTSEIILDNNGTIDKYIGDAIMAIFGAPVYKRTHSYDACRAALLYQKGLEELRLKMREKGQEPVFARIGINTGDMVVGNMGCNIGKTQKFNYTVIGDEVNLASRLESASKFYGTQILVGENTYNEEKDNFLFRLVDFVRVKGKKKAVAVYELMGFLEDKELARYIKKYNDALDLYHQRDFIEAKKKFEDLYKVDNHNGPIKIYLDRIEEVKGLDLGEDWDYSYTMKTK